VNWNAAGLLVSASTHWAAGRRTRSAPATRHFVLDTVEHEERFGLTPRMSERRSSDCHTRPLPGWESGGTSGDEAVGEQDFPAVGRGLRCGRDLTGRDQPIRRGRTSRAGNLRRRPGDDGQQCAASCGDSQHAPASSCLFSPADPWVTTGRLVPVPARRSRRVTAHRRRPATPPTRPGSSPAPADPTPAAACPA